MTPEEQYPYPRRRVIRYLLNKLALLTLHTLSDFQVIGRENLPEKGPLLLVGNHFHFGDPVIAVAIARWPMEFVGGFQFIDGPTWTHWIPSTWGFYKLRRGNASKDALRAGTAVLKQNGILGIFPEGGSWAPVLRPPRPGTAYLAVRSGAPIIPIGIDGLINLFPYLRQRKRATVTVRIGKPFGPFTAEGRGRQRREQLDAISDEIMQQIANLIPPERHGVYSTDPILRTEAEKVAAWPFDDPDKAEGTI
ncbi:MAG: 1-acyl-sn-glycerol-3-phosphate acyltransferase [Ardenticatenaceae bacterium]|nr:1-acyl-sn-glycerol-3-phosphate acyltransferase [Ardenticatenaceae bacterium]MCB9444706.1 1-acyl-sn-glycerol-3-phosphate acyltransferase [Ardenticatenaceae bacterium]